MYALLLGGFSIFFVNGAPFLMNVVDKGNQNGAFSVQTAVLSLAGFVGSLIGGAAPEIIAGLQNLTLDDPAPYRMTLMFVSAVIGVSFLLVLTVKEPPEIELDNLIDESQTSIKPKPKESKWTTHFVLLLLLMSFVRVLQVSGSATAIVYFNVYMDTQLQVSTAVIGAIAAIGRLIGVPTALLVPVLVRRWGNGTVVIWASLATAACLLPLALIPNWFAASLGFIGVLAVNSIRFTAYLVYILELVPKFQQSIMSGGGEMASGFSFAMMAMGGGIILSLFTFRDLFLVGSGLTVIGAFVFWLHFRTVDPKRKIKPAIQSIT